MFCHNPQSVSPVPGSSLGIVPLVAALCRVHGAEAAEAGQICNMYIDIVHY